MMYEIRLHSVAKNSYRLNIHENSTCIIITIITEEFMSHLNQEDFNGNKRRMLFEE